MKASLYSTVVALVLSTAICAYTASAASTLPLASPEEVGLSQDRLDRISAIIQNDVDTHEISGASAMIIRKGKIAYYENFGYADREARTPMTEDSLFRIYSMSKPITSVALMMLFEEGKFFLDDPVKMYIPELGNLQVVTDNSDETAGSVFNLPEDDPEASPPPSPAKVTVETEPSRRDMTVRDLMRHTAGLTYGFFGGTSVDKMYQANGVLLTDKNLADMVTKLGKTPLLFHPGEKWHYSVSVDVMGRLVEVLSGQTFDVFLAERIFEPLGMIDTGFYAPEEKLDRLTKLYSPKEGRGIEPAMPLFSRNFVRKPALFSGGGGLISTTHDYARFSQMLLNGGHLDGERILSRKTIELMTKNHIQHIDNGQTSPGYGFGLGFAVALDRGQSGSPATEGEYNWGGAAGTRFWIDPEEELIGIYMVQILPHVGNFGYVFKNMVYQTIDD